MQAILNKTSPKQLVIPFLIFIFFLVGYSWVNLACPGELGGDNKFCYANMAAALLDDDPTTGYDTDYFYNRGVIFPLLYAGIWKLTYGVNTDFNFNLFQHDQIKNIILISGAFFMVSALFIFLAVTLRTRHLMVFIITMGFYLQIDPFFEILNNGFIDGFYFFVTSIGMYFLTRVIIAGGRNDSYMLGIIWFVLPMIRANGIFFILLTALALCILCFTRRKNKIGRIGILRQSYGIILFFALSNIIYEIVIYSLDWQPSNNIIKHHPLLIMLIPGMQFHIAGDAKLFNDIADMKSSSQFFVTAKQFVQNIIQHLTYIFLKSSGGITSSEVVDSQPGRMMGNMRFDYLHCKNTVLHILHGSFLNIAFIKVTVIFVNISFLLYQFVKRDKVVLLMYLGAMSHIIVQSLAGYEARYHVFIYFVLFYPFFWLLDQIAGNAGRPFLKSSNPCTLKDRTYPY